VYAGAHTANTGFRFTVAGTNVEWVTGNAGNDVIDASGDNGFVQSYGEGGDDTLIGGSGEDWMFGGAGSDTAVFAGNRADYNILEDYGGWTGWTALIDASGQIDWVISVEKLQFADQTIDAPGARPELVGTENGDAIAAGAARAEIFGLAGDDVLAGGVGDDLIYGGPGADTIAGGDGSDVLFVDNDDTIHGGEGFDYAWADDSRGPLGLVFDAAGTSIEFVWGGMGNDVIDASGVAGAAYAGGTWGIQVQGNAGDDMLIGSLFADIFMGDGGHDTMVFAGNHADYTITAPDAYGNVRVTETATGVTDWLYGVETAKFADGSWALQ
jgi:Ca2+-binding RTX toxin-like protein